MSNFIVSSDMIDDLLKMHGETLMCEIKWLSLNSSLWTDYYIFSFF